MSKSHHMRRTGEAPGAPRREAGDKPKSRGGAKWHAPPMPIATAHCFRAFVTSAIMHTAQQE